MRYLKIFVLVLVMVALAVGSGYAKQSATQKAEAKAAKVEAKAAKAEAKAEAKAAKAEAKAEAKAVKAEVKAAKAVQAITAKIAKVEAKNAKKEAKVEAKNEKRLEKAEVKNVKKLEKAVRKAEKRVEKAGDNEAKLRLAAKKNELEWEKTNQKNAKRIAQVNDKNSAKLVNVQQNNAERLQRVEDQYKFGVDFDYKRDKGSAGGILNTRLVVKYKDRKWELPMCTEITGKNERKAPVEITATRDGDVFLIKARYCDHQYGIRYFEYYYTFDTRTNKLEMTGGSPISAGFRYRTETYDYLGTHSLVTEMVLYQGTNHWVVAVDKEYMGIEALGNAAVQEIKAIGEYQFITIKGTLTTTGKEYTACCRFSAKDNKLELIAERIGYFKETDKYIYGAREPVYAAYLIPGIHLCRYSKETGESLDETYVNAESINGQGYVLELSGGNLLYVQLDGGPQVVIRDPKTGQILSSTTMPTPPWEDTHYGFARGCGPYNLSYDEATNVLTYGVRGSQKTYTLALNPVGSAPNLRTSAVVDAEVLARKGVEAQVGERANDRRFSNQMAGQDNQLATLVNKH